MYFNAKLYTLLKNVGHRQYLVNLSPEHNNANIIHTHIIYIYIYIYLLV
jgi:hypothetical protein